MTAKSESPGGSVGNERRRAKRRPILSTFSIFIAIPKKGVHRLAVHDVSELGIGLDLDIEGESKEDFAAGPGDPLEIQLYLNQSLFIPLSLTLVRIVDRAGIRHVGAEFVNKSEDNYKALVAFLAMLDKIADVAQIVPDGA